MKKLVRINTHHLLRLWVGELITKEEILSYILADGVISLDPNLFPDLVDKTSSFFSSIPGYPATNTSLDYSVAGDFVLRLHDAGLVSKEQVRTWFGVGSEVCPCGGSGSCVEMPTIWLNGLTPNT